MARLPEPVARRGRGVFAYFVRHGTAANLLLLAMVLLGAAGLTGNRTELWAQRPQHEVDIRVYWHGAGPRDVDESVVQALVPGLMDMDAADDVVALAQEGWSRITVKLREDADLMQAVDDADTVVEDAPSLPDSIQNITVKPGRWGGWVTNAVIHGPVPLEQLTVYVREFQRMLRGAGVSRLVILGQDDAHHRIEAREAALVRHDVTLADIIRVVEAAVVASPGGRTGDGQSRVRAGEAQRTPEALADLEILTRADGSKLRVRDVADVITDDDQRERRYLVDGHPAILMRIERSAEDGTLETFEAAQDVVAELQTTLPEGVRIQLINTWAGIIERRLALLLDNAALGLAAVVGVLFLFLSARTALWVAMGVPAALMTAIGAMWLVGVTINLVSVFALIIVLGMVVDDAIVVGEHADALRRRGLSPTQAAERAAQRMAGPVFAASVTTVIAFSAIYMIGGRFGNLVADIPTTVALVLIASLIECFLILPNHMRHSLRDADRQAWYDAPSRAVNRGLDAFKARVFRPLMGWAIRLRYPVLGAAVLLLMLTVEMLATGDPPWRFWNPPERNRFTGEIAMAATATREHTLAQLELVDAAVDQVAAELAAEHGLNPVDFVLLQIGGGAGRGLAVRDDREPWQLASISVELVDAEHRPYSSQDMARRVEEAVRLAPLAETVAFTAERAGPGEESLKVRLVSEDLAALEQAAAALKSQLDGLAAVSGVQDDMAPAEREVTLELTPLGRALGFTSDAVGRILFNRLSGRTAAEFPVDRRVGKVIVALSDEEITSDYLARARVRAPTGDWVPLGEIVELTSQPGYARLRRHDGRMSVTVWGEVSEEDAAAAGEVDRLVTERILPDIAERYGISWRMAGLKRQERAFLADSGTATLYALAGIYLALAWVFASWARPFAVLLAAPFGFIGAVWGHWIMGVPMSMFSIVGLIGMLGIIINDSIVLVTTIDEYARRRALAPALLDAVCDRLRPVLLTTLTTVLGLAPMLWENSEQARQLKPTIITLCFGLGFGLFVVLAITPALAMAQRDVGAALASLRRMARQVRSPRRGLGRRAA